MLKSGMPSPSSTGTRWTKISSMSPALMHCAATSAPEYPDVLGACCVLGRGDGLLGAARRKRNVAGGPPGRGGEPRPRAPPKPPVDGPGAGPGPDAPGEAPPAGQGPPGGDLCGTE